MKIIAIAYNSFKEWIRDRILYNLLIFAILIIGLSAILSTLTIGERLRIILNIGLAATNIFGIMMAIFLGIGLVYKEIDRKTIYTILSKPLKRWHFLIGKFLGLLLTLALNLSIMTVGLLSVIYLMGGSVGPVFFKSVFLFFIEFVLIASIALLFSCFSTPALSTIFTLSLYVIGHLTGDIKFFGSKAESLIIKKASAILYYILPNLDIFDIKGLVVYNNDVSYTFLALSTLYGLCYSGLVFLLAVVIFQKKNFN